MKVLVASDVHANLVALEAVLADCPAVDALWNLGDTVGYGPHPRQCVDAIIGLGASVSLVGNHDLACLGALDLASFNPVAKAAALWTTAQLGEEHRAYLGSLPAATEAVGYALAHGSPREPVWEYIADAATAKANFGHFAGRACLVGHTHVPMAAVLTDGQVRVTRLSDGECLELTGGRHIINPGSVGQPRDHDPRAAYAVLDTELRTITIRRVAYDVAATQRAMVAAGLPDMLVARLAVGR